MENPVLNEYMSTTHVTIKMGRRHRVKYTART
jgi:hypothetical protein